LKDGKLRKHNIDIMFLMVLFLIFTFSAVSVLLMAVNSYRAVVLANESNANTRTATAFIREEVRSHDKGGSISLDTIDGRSCIKMSEGEGFSLYIYEYDGYLMELEAKDGSGATADFGNKILKVNSMEITEEGQDKLQVQIEDDQGAEQSVIIGIKSVEVESDAEE
jgi:hypothetical protein